MFAICQESTANPPVPHYHAHTQMVRGHVCQNLHSILGTDPWIQTLHQSLSLSFFFLRRQEERREVSTRTMSNATGVSGSALSIYTGLIKTPTHTHSQE